MIPVYNLVFTGPSSPSVLINPQWVLDTTQELKHLTMHLLELHTCFDCLEATGKHLLFSLTQWLVTPEASDPTHPYSFFISPLLPGALITFPAIIQHQRRWYQSQFEENQGV